MVEIFPSILAASFARLEQEVRAVEGADVTTLHLDVMDGHFVPNISFGAPVIRSLRAVTSLRFDVHLMIEQPDRYLRDFIEAGANMISVHQEACRHLDRTLRAIQDEGLPAGVVINPATPVEALDEVLPFVDYVLVMSVNPGFGGQRFIPSALRKIAALDRRRQRDGFRYKIEVDGGVGPSNIAELANAGCDWMVAGSSVFGTGDAAAAARELRQMCLVKV